jgi:hypothetical protein
MAFYRDNRKLGDVVLAEPSFFRRASLSATGAPPLSEAFQAYWQSSANVKRRQATAAKLELF